MPKTVRPAAYSEMQARIGERICWVRELVEPNQSKAARLLNIDPSTLSKIETGDRAPSIFNVLEIANRFRVTTDYLLRGDLRGSDEEIALILAARHPELALTLDMTRKGHRDTGHLTDTRPEPRRR